MGVSKSSKLIIVRLLTTLYCMQPTFSNEKANLATIYPGEPCDYYDRIPDVEESDLSSNRCLFEGGETGYELPSDVDGFVSQIVARDFPGYQREESWVLIADTAYAVVNLKRIASRPPGKAVWFCSSPETQPLTTKTSIFALCSASPNKQGTGYEATVSFYEFQQSKAGFASRRIYNEGAMVQEEGMTSVLFSVDFSLLSGKLLATIEKHFFTRDAEVKKLSSLLVYREKNFKSLLAFESLLGEVQSGPCSDGDQSSCQPFLRWFQVQGKHADEADTVLFFEGKGYDGYVREPLKEIPFILDAKNWTLKRKFPRKSDETF